MISLIPVGRYYYTHLTDVEMGTEGKEWMVHSTACQN